MLKHTNLLEVKQLSIAIRSEKGLFNAVDEVNFNLKAGKTLALLGESGCGKSITALALMQLLPPAARIYQASEILLEQQNLLALPEVILRTLRGKRIGMIFQEPMTSLNPVMKIGKQIEEVLLEHFNLSHEKAKKRVIALLKSVGMPEAEHRYHEYPHQLSGGMKQRIMIAMALAGEPDILIADEPTTALDVTIQLQILLLLKELQMKTGMAMLFITHDLGVVRLIADEVAVMYAGQIVEHADAKLFFQQAKHPYSQGLMSALPSLEKRNQPLTTIPGTVPDMHQDITACRFKDRCPFAWDSCYEKNPRFLLQEKDRLTRCHLYDKAIPQSNRSSVVKPPPEKEALVKTVSKESLLTVKNLKIHFPIQQGILKRTVGHVKAVDGVNIALQAGKTLALVGESGCGKTTMGRGMLQLIQPTAGEIHYQDQDLSHLNKNNLHQLRSDLQIIFQDPYASMNPRMMVMDILAEGIRAHQSLTANELDATINDLLKKVGLSEEAKHRYPHQFSGGQRQRLCIARALAVNPKIIICDEPTSALDVSVQAQILNLLKSIQQEQGLAYLFITHDISVVSYLADEIAVMYLGRIVEYGPAEEILLSPKHPYTQSLLAAVPSLTQGSLQQEQLIKGEQPSPINPPMGCHFHPRCPKVMDICRKNYPEETNINSGHCVRCYLYPDDKG